MNVKEFINMIRENHKQDTTIYVNTEKECLGMIPPGYFIHTDELEKIMSKVGGLEVKNFFIGRENPAKAFCFSDLFICLNVTDKVSEPVNEVSNEDILKSIKELHKKIDKLPSYEDIKNIKTNYDGDDWSLM